MNVNTEIRDGNSTVETCKVRKLEGGKNDVFTFDLIQLDEDESIIHGSDQDMEAYRKAQSLQRDVEQWIKRGKYGRLTADDVCSIETGIRIEEKKCVIYVPEGKKEELIAQLQADISLIDEALIEDLPGGTRGKHCNQPGHTGLVFGDGSLGTLGAYLKGVQTGNIYALSSCHGSSRPEVGRDIFTATLRAGNFPHYERLGRCVAHAYQQDPVVDACLILVDRELINSLDFSMQMERPGPAILLYTDNQDMHENMTRPKVFKIGKSTSLTVGKMTEYERIVQYGAERFTGNFVTISERPGSAFAMSGDSGAVISKAVRMGAQNGNFYCAISVHYLGSEIESFSFPLKRAIELLSYQVAEPMELISQGMFNHQQ